MAPQRQALNALLIEGRAGDAGDPLGGAKVTLTVSVS